MKKKKENEKRRGIERKTLSQRGLSLQFYLVQSRLSFRLGFDGLHGNVAAPGAGGQIDEGQTGVEKNSAPLCLRCVGV